jgi:predicted ester cyclase
MSVRVVVAVAMLLFAVSIVGCSSCEQELESNKAIVLKAAEALANHEYGTLDQFFTQDYQRHCQATPEATVNSLDDFKALAEQFDQSFTDVEMTIDMLVAEGDMVAVYGVYSGTHTGQMGPHSPTGKRVDSDFAGIHRIENGKIAETWVTWDNVAILAQLGLFPPPATEATDVDEQPGKG